MFNPMFNRIFNRKVKTVLAVLVMMLPVAFSAATRPVGAVSFVGVSASTNRCSDQCTVRFSVSTDCNGCLFRWQVDGSTLGSGFFFTHTFTSSGIHNVTVTASDIFAENSKSATVQVTVQK